MFTIFIKSSANAICFYLLLIPSIPVIAQYIYYLLCLLFCLATCNCLFYCLALPISSPCLPHCLVCAFLFLFLSAVATPITLPCLLFSPILPFMFPTIFSGRTQGTQLCFATLMKYFQFALLSLLIRHENILARN